MILLKIAGVLLTIWMLYFMILGFINLVATRIALHRDPVRWLRRRGVNIDEHDLRPLSVLWLRGEMPKIRYLEFPWIVAVVTPDVLVLEGQIPFRIKRSRVVTSKMDRLRTVGSDVASMEGIWRVASKPDDALPSLLISRGWTIASA